MSIGSFVGTGQNAAFFVEIVIVRDCSAVPGRKELYMPQSLRPFCIFGLLCVKECLQLLVIQRCIRTRAPGGLRMRALHRGDVVLR